MICIIHAIAVVINHECNHVQQQHEKFHPIELTMKNRLGYQNKRWNVKIVKVGWGRWGEIGFGERGG